MEPGPTYRPFGWEQWPDYPWMSYQFRRALGETQEGGGRGVRAGACYVL